MVKCLTISHANVKRSFVTTSIAKPTSHYAKQFSLSSLDRWAFAKKATCDTTNERLTIMNPPLHEITYVGRGPSGLRPVVQRDITFSSISFDMMYAEAKKRSAAHC